MRSGGARGYGAAPARVSSGFAAGRGAMPAGRPFGGAAGFHGGTWAHGSGTWVHGGPGFGHHGFHHHHGFFFRSFNPACFNGFCNNVCFNGLCNFGFGGYPAYYAPPIFWPSFDYADYGTQSYAAAPAQPVNYTSDTTALQVQIQHLTDEVEQLREEQQQRNQPPPVAAPARPSRMDLPTVLVFRDGRVKEVQNYGIVGQTLWIFDELHARKVPLGDLDLAATRAANDDRGGFALPASR